jgi:hypothetical protein
MARPKQEKRRPGDGWRSRKRRLRKERTLRNHFKQRLRELSKPEEPPSPGDELNAEDLLTKTEEDLKRLLEKAHRPSGRPTKKTHLASGKAKPTKKTHLASGKAKSGSGAPTIETS